VHIVRRSRGWYERAHSTAGRPIAMVEEGREVVAFASTSSYRARPCYAGIAEFSVYVARHRRGAGSGQVAMTALLEAAEAAGFWKLISRIFHRTRPAVLYMVCEVGTYLRRQTDGVWGLRLSRHLLGEATHRMRRRASSFNTWYHETPPGPRLLPRVSGIPSEAAWDH
jgi:GNAT superfamily N-acetyltransferase